MTALEKLISIADGTTDESMHVCVPVSLIRELQAWNPGEKERLTTNGAKAWVGVDPQSLRDEPEHVQRAEMDATEIELARKGADWVLAFTGNSWRQDGIDHFAEYDGGTEPDDVESRAKAIEWLRYRGLLVEHGDGVVSIRGNG